jgi:hypothetical protein
MEWQHLTLSKMTEDEEYYYYYMDVPSYSATFAIVGTELVEIQPYQSGVPEISWTTILLTIVLATVLLIFGLFKTGCIYQVEDTVDKNKKEKIIGTQIENGPIILN